MGLWARYTCTWGTFDHRFFRVILGPFGALSQNGLLLENGWPLSGKDWKWFFSLLRNTSPTYMGNLWPYFGEYHLKVIWCNCLEIGRVQQLFKFNIFIQTECTHQEERQDILIRCTSCFCSGSSLNNSVWFLHYYNTNIFYGLLQLIGQSYLIHNWGVKIKSFCYITN